MSDPCQDAKDLETLACDTVNAALVVAKASSRAVGELCPQQPPPAAREAESECTAPKEAVEAMQSIIKMNLKALRDKCPEAADSLLKAL